ncbi:MAG: hypothetical protein L7S56_01535 [Candidatus Poseidonia sp.]|nr:hypothetical protein [Poseidonia sp.]
MTGGFAMELCGNKASWQVVPDGIDTIDLERVGTAIVADGYQAEVQSRMCWTFTGACDMTLYPSGKLMVKTEDKDLASEVAQLHVTSWVLA